MKFLFCIILSLHVFSLLERERVSFVKKINFESFQSWKNKISEVPKNFYYLNITSDDIIYVTLVIIISEVCVAGSQIFWVIFTNILILLNTHENREVSADVVGFCLNLAGVFSNHLQAVKHDDLELNFSKGGHGKFKV